MKINFDKRVLAASVAAACSWLGQDALAAGTHVVSVNATVTSKCTFDTANSTLAMTVDPAGTGNVVGSQPVTYRCTKGAAATMTISAGASGNLVNGAESLPYTASATAGGTGLGFGTGNSLVTTVDVTVNQTLAQNVAAGTYTGTITLSVTP